MGDNHITKVEAFLTDDLNFNVDGNDLTPIIYKDRTYIPVCSLLEDKGVTVGYEAESRTVLLNYSTMNVEKPIDKATPLLFNTRMVDADIGGAGKATFKEFSVKKNPDFEVDTREMTQEINFNLSEEARIEIDGRLMDSSLDELLKSETSWNMSSAVLSINEETGAVEKMSISTIKSDNETPIAAKFHIEIIISGPPWKVTIKITF